MFTPLFLFFLLFPSLPPSSPNFLARFEKFVKNGIFHLFFLYLSLIHAHSSYPTHRFAQLRTFSRYSKIVSTTKATRRHRTSSENVSRTCNNSAIRKGEKKWRYILKGIFCPYPCLPLSIPQKSGRSCENPSLFFLAINSYRVRRINAPWHGLPARPTFHNFLPSKSVARRFLTSKNSAIP